MKGTDEDSVIIVDFFCLYLLRDNSLTTCDVVLLYYESF